MSYDRFASVICFQPSFHTHWTNPLICPSDYSYTGVAPQLYNLAELVTNFMNNIKWFDTPSPLIIINMLQMCPQIQNLDLQTVLQIVLVLVILLLCINFCTVDVFHTPPHGPDILWMHLKHIYSHTNFTWYKNGSYHKVTAYYDTYYKNTHKLMSIFYIITGKIQFEVGCTW